MFIRFLPPHPNPLPLGEGEKKHTKQEVIIMRRLPIFFLLDVSESMAGDNLRQLQQGLERLVCSLRTDPHALETVYLSIIAFAGKAKTLTPLVEVASFYPPRLPIGSGTALGNALEHLMAEIDKNVIKTTPDRKGDWKPVVYIMTDGKPSDTLAYSEVLAEVKRRPFAKVIACAAGFKADATALKRLTDTVVSLDTMDSSTFSGFFQWVSATVSSSQSNSQVDNFDLPPPPAEINVVI